MKDKPYTTKQAADILGVSPQTLVRLYDCGKLKGFLHPGKGRFRRITPESLIDFLKTEGYLSNPVYVDFMRATWKEYEFSPF